MTNVKLRITYDGTAYFGWQRTNAGPSIEQELQTALEIILQHPVLLQAASRTDRGVHAGAQIVNFFLEKPHADFQKFQFQLNSLLPKDIRVLAIECAPPHFHPTLDVEEKTYRYCITAAPFQMPHERHYAWHVYYPLDFSLMQKAAPFFEGTHDFKGFTNRKPDELYSDTSRTIQKINMEQQGNAITFTITGNHFLYKMVRNIVGTLVFIGCKKLPVNVINEVLMHRKRTFAGITAPAHGLTLINIKYRE